MSAYYEQVETSGGYTDGRLAVIGSYNMGVGAEWEALDSQGNRHFIPVLTSSSRTLYKVAAEGGNSTRVRVYTDVIPTGRYRSVCVTNVSSLPTYKMGPYLEGLSSWSYNR